MWRDRTNLFITLRQAHIADHPVAPRRHHALPEEERGLMADDVAGDTIIEMGALPPRWLDVQDDVMEKLTVIAGKAAELDRLHQKHVLPGFDDEAVKRQEERRIEMATDEITRGFRDCRSSIQRIEKLLNQQRHSQGVSAQQETMARNVQVALAARVQEVSAAFRKKQSSYLKKMQSLRGISAPIGPSMQNPYTDPSMAETADDRQFSQSALRQTTAGHRSANDAVIAQREMEINDIAQGIIQLADIFTDLQAMVIDQGTVLDRIDYNIENMAINVKEADKELKVATNYQRKYTKRKIMFLLMLLVVGLLIVLLLKPRRTEVTRSSSKLPDHGPVAESVPEDSPPELNIARPKPP